MDTKQAFNVEKKKLSEALHTAVHIACQCEKLGSAVGVSAFANYGELRMQIIGLHRRAMELEQGKVV
jgi:hypothetical protein